MLEIREVPDAAVDSIVKYAQRAESESVRLVCFPECFLQGYLCEPHTARRHAISLRSEAFDRILSKLAGIKPMLVFGLIEMDEESVYNAAVVIDAGKLIGSYRKINLLPGERAAFSPGTSPGVFAVDGMKFGINICSDTQNPQLISDAVAAGARLVVVPSNNMMKQHKAEFWKDRHNETRTQRAQEAGVWFMSSDVTGARGDSVGLGPTCVIDPQGRVVAQVPLMEEGLVVAEFQPR